MSGVGGAGGVGGGGGAGAGGSGGVGGSGDGGAGAGGVGGTGGDSGSNAGGTNGANGSSGTGSGGVGGTGTGGVGGPSSDPAGGFADAVSNATANANNASDPNANTGGPANGVSANAGPAGGVCTAADPMGLGTAAASFNADPNAAPSIGAPSLAGPQSPVGVDGFGMTTPGATLSSAFGPSPDPSLAIGFDMGLASAQTIGQGLAGYTNGMYGEVNAFNQSIQTGTMERFGQIAPNSTLADRSFYGRGFGIDDFAGPGRAQATMIGHQGNFAFATAEAARLGVPADQVALEIRDPVLGQNRTYDNRIGPAVDAFGQPTPLNEVKMGQTFSAAQLAKDVNVANAGTPVNYQFGPNPISGNHGPTPAGVQQLNNAVAAANGNLNYNVVDAGPSRAAMEAVEAASHVSRAARAAGRIAGPVGLAADAYNIGAGVAADGGTFGRNATAATAGAVGGWGGAAVGGWGGVQAGAAIGAIGGPAGAAVGAVVGGLIGAIGGGFFGGWGAEAGARAVMG